MQIIIGHSNMDLDCLGSMVLARYLYPDFKLLRSTHIHPAAKNLYNLYQNHLNLLNADDVKELTVEKIVVVDTRVYGRIKEYGEIVENFQGVIDVFDHHLAEPCDIERAAVHEKALGANTTLLGIELLRRNIPVVPEDATIALAGIYADTGNFTHDNVTDDDFKVATYLMQQKASVKLVKKFLTSLPEDYQITIFHELMNGLVYKNLNGHLVILSFIELEKQMSGLAAVVEKIFEVENVDAIFAVFSFIKEKDVIIIARSQKETIDVHEILKRFGGGGHSQASSALLKNTSGEETLINLHEHLRNSLKPALHASDIMARDVGLIDENWSLLQASMFLENINHTGAPVTAAGGELVGFMTLKDIMKARKAGQMHAPVKAYMARKVVTGQEDTTIREIEQLLYKNNIGHLPIVQDRKVVGIVTRTDYLKLMKDSLVY
ncbi:MAG: CBS domain-containing protein [Spirochaetota bacterium]